MTGRSGADTLVLSQTPGQAKNSSKGSGGGSSSSTTSGAGSSVGDVAPTPVRQDDIGEYSSCDGRALDVARTLCRPTLYACNPSDWKLLLLPVTAIT